MENEPMIAGDETGNALDPALSPKADKKRWPLDFAEQVAADVVEMIAPFCERWIVAGSIRRRKAMVGDVEIVFVPKMETEKVDFFNTRQVSQVDIELAKLLAKGFLRKRPSVTGSFAWGAKNKLAVHYSGMAVDLFATQSDYWWNYLVCRTGGAESNTAVASAAQRMGWKWNPTGLGFSRPSGGGNELKVVKSERDVFEFVGLPYLEPEARK